MCLMTCLKNEEWELLAEGIGAVYDLPAVLPSMLKQESRVREFTRCTNMSDHRIAQLEQEKAKMAERISELEEALRTAEELENKRLHGIIVQQLFRINYLEELLDQARGRSSEFHTSTKWNPARE
ncbi:hypothetical protein B9Z55_022647 [Caenorhabditis nigoni]|uniref:Uncharacterized protein n=1 Tax=Caenorhabditis nigoni TaxID=1611254 RepID=A0A2G5SLL9_9PELO|nr:hypothetical protein B9Z55_022647 [Caenorhabditis nigoni]